MESIFPEKNVKISSFDKPYFTEELRQIRRHRQRIYRKFGRCKKYIEIRNKFDLKLKLAAAKYKQKILSEIAEGKRNDAYASLRKLETGVNTGKNSHFTLPEHAEEDLSVFHSATGRLFFHLCPSVRITFPLVYQT